MSKLLWKDNSQLVVLFFVAQTLINTFTTSRKIIEQTFFSSKALLIIVVYSNIPDQLFNVIPNSKSKKEYKK